MKQLIRATWLFVASSSLLSLVSAQFGPDPKWLEPNGSYPDFSETYTNGNTVNLQWMAFGNSTWDLWLTPWDASTSTFKQVLQTGIYVGEAGSFEWNIQLESSTIVSNNRFVLRFVSEGAQWGPLYFGNGSSSPGFAVQQRSANENSATTSSATTSSSSAAAAATSSSAAASSSASSTITSAASSTSRAATNAAASASSSPTATPNAGSSGLSGGAIAGIVIGAAFAVGFLIAVGWFIGRDRRKRRSRAISGLSEAPDAGSLTPTEEYKTIASSTTDPPSYRPNSLAKPYMGHQGSEVIPPVPSELGTTESRYSRPELA